MKFSTLLSTGFFATVIICSTSAQLVTIEPDNFADATVLNTTFPQVSLVTAGANNLPIPFDVTASFDGFGYTSTGTKVFGHAGGIPFWNSNRRLRMDFSNPLNSIAIDFIGGWTLADDIGKLDVFNSSGTLLASYTTAPRPADSVETMSITRPIGDIAWAIAYMPADGGDFGRLDNLRFTVAPEPTTFAITLLAAGFSATRFRRRAK